MTFFEIVLHARHEAIVGSEQEEILKLFVEAKALLVLVPAGAMRGALAAAPP